MKQFKELLSFLNYVCFIFLFASFIFSYSESGKNPIKKNHLVVNCSNISKLQKYAAWGVLGGGIATACYSSVLFDNYVKGVGTKVKWYLALGPIDTFVTRLESQPSIVRLKQQCENIFEGKSVNYNLTQFPKKILNSKQIKKQRNKRIVVGTIAVSAALLTCATVVIYPPFGAKALKQCMDVAKKYMYMRGGKSGLSKIKNIMNENCRVFLFEKPAVYKRPNYDI